MKLMQIWHAREAFRKLAGLNKPPKLAYRLMKYERSYMAEYDTIDKHREKLVYEVSGEPVGSVVQLADGSPQSAEFFRKFNEFLEGDSDLAVVGLNMDALIDGLEAETGNVLSETDLELLEVFFSEKKVTDLKLVEAQQS